MESFMQGGVSYDSGPAPFQSMMKVSQLIFRFASIRTLVNKYDESIQSLSQERKEQVHFVTPELILTQYRTPSEQNGLKSCFLKGVVTPAEILRFIKSNRNLMYADNGVFRLRSVEERKKYPSDFQKLPIESMLQKLDNKFDGEIWEFDDEYPSSELLFAVVVNRTEKRIVCVFRGSVTKKDWSVNMNILQESPDILKDFAPKDIGIHSGFADYMFNACWTGEGQPSKFQQIVDILKEIGTKVDPTGNGYKDYSIYVTGHSLGGALAQLFSFALAGSSMRTNEIPMPITAITFGSPRVGNRQWLRAFQSLEKKGILRHLCISNSGDLICVSPKFGYSQTGVNIHLQKRKPAKIGYSVQRNYVSSFECCSNIPNLHSLVVYYERLIGDGTNKDLLKKSVEEIYKQQNIVKRKNKSKLHQKYLNVDTKELRSNSISSVRKRAHVGKMYRDFLSS